MGDYTKKFDVQDSCWLNVEARLAQNHRHCSPLHLLVHLNVLNYIFLTAAFVALVDKLQVGVILAKIFIPPPGNAPLLATTTAQLSFPRLGPREHLHNFL